MIKQIRPTKRKRFPTPGLDGYAVCCSCHRGRYLETCLETRFWKPRSRSVSLGLARSRSVSLGLARSRSVSLGLVTPKFRLGRGLRTFRLESRSRHCSNACKDHSCCKCVMIFGKNRLFVRFLAVRASWPFINFPLVTV